MAAPSKKKARAKSRAKPSLESETVIRVRKALARRRGISESRMFGGACFFANGNMIGGVTGEERLVVRVGPEQYEESLADPHAGPMDFTKRPMRGFVYVDLGGYESDEGLRAWLEKGLRYARSLPPKPKKA